MECKCARCGEIITSPYFFQGAPFGWTCIKIVNPLQKKKKAAVKEHWVVADSSDFVADYKKQQVTAFWNGYKFKFWALPAKTIAGKDIYIGGSIVEFGINGDVYINLGAYKKYPNILNPRPPGKA